MSQIVVYHELAIGDAISNKHEKLSVTSAASKEEVLDSLPRAEVFLTNARGWDDAFLDGLSKGDWVQATSAGYAAFPVDTFEKRGIVFTNAQGNYGSPVGDHSLALILALARQIHTCLSNQRHRHYDRQMDVIELKGRTLTVVGLGDIGDAIAHRGQCFGMEVYGTKRDPESYNGCLPPERVKSANKLSNLLSETDVLVLSVPLTSRTHHLIDADALEALPESALLVNVARGRVISEDALIEALEAGEIAGAGLDVFETEPLPETSPLWDRDDVIITPHIAGRSQSFVPRFVEHFLENYDRWQKEKSLKNRIV